jgi:hypothetical protein
MLVSSPLGVAVIFSAEGSEPLNRVDEHAMKPFNRVGRVPKQHGSERMFSQIGAVVQMAECFVDEVDKRYKITHGRMIALAGLGYNAAR